MNVKINHIVKEEFNIINETYNSITELRELTTKVLKYTAEYNLNQYLKDGEFKYIYGLYLSSINLDDFNEINDFILDTKIIITFSPNNNSQKTVKADYSTLYLQRGEKYNPRIERDINLYYNYNDFKFKVDEQIKNNGLELFNLYSDLYYEFHSSLLHELQHAYDDYRSKSMTFNTKENKNYQAKIKSDILKDLAQVKDYLNLPHEIWARFSQTIDKLRFYTFDVHNNNTLEYKMYPIRNVVNDFTKTFNGYHTLPLTMKKKLINRVAQFWHFEYDRVNKLNQEQEALK